MRRLLDALATTHALIGGALHGQGQVAP